MMSVKSRILGILNGKKVLPSGQFPATELLKVTLTDVQPTAEGKVKFSLDIEVFMPMD